MLVISRQAAVLRLLVLKSPGPEAKKGLDSAVEVSQIFVLE